MRSTDPLVHKLGDRWVYRPVDNETIHKRHLYLLRVGHGNVGHQRYGNPEYHHNDTKQSLDRVNSKYRARWQGLSERSGYPHCT